MDWRQLTLALLLVLCALDLKAEILKGYPCIRRLNQLYCPTPGNSYPKVNWTGIEGGERYKGKRVKRERIDMFIDENKALIRRMFGEYSSPDEDGGHRDHYETYDGKTIHTRTERSRSSFAGASSNKVDACESAVEIVTPYWASNSAGKIRAIVNTQHLQQAIQQEVCQSVQTKKCNNDCSCEQKYKWHRLLAYDPDDDCKGIFMDWFLFPSCCVCRCANPIKK
ncbi:protein spaetzle 3-like isoform X1 [Dermacentor silvarum]|uniref:protein spaetzle 3-like isoform X1 n=1 Tax=Dermacentor silvarum TaxID=543639 RepID=UPI00189C47F4|nr:protein spaetzle 3-like isoform X1 [Dermacentor silvarum]